MKYPQKHVQVFFGSTTPKMSDMTGFMKEFDIDSGFLFQKLHVCLEAYFTLHRKTEWFPLVYLICNANPIDAINILISLNLLISCPVAVDMDITSD